MGLSWPGDQASLEAELRRIDLLGPGSNWTAATTVTSPKSGTWMDAVVAFAGAQVRARVCAQELSFSARPACPSCLCRRAAVRRDS